MEKRGREWGLARRMGLALSGLSYAGLAIVAAERAITGGYVEDPKADWTRQLVVHPVGAVLVGAVGVGLALAALYQWYAAAAAGFSRYLRDAPASGAFVMLGRYGLAMRGVVFGIVSVFLVRAAWQGIFCWIIQRRDRITAPCQPTPQRALIANHHVPR